MLYSSPLLASEEYLPLLFDQQTPQSSDFAAERLADYEEAEDARQ